MGGTFMSLDADYRDYFVRNLHDALSGHSSTTIDEAVRYVRSCLSVSVCRYSERSLTKCIGITIETRPDYCLKPHLRSAGSSTSDHSRSQSCFVYFFFKGMPLLYRVVSEPTSNSSIINPARLFTC